MPEINDLLWETYRDVWNIKLKILKYNKFNIKLVNIEKNSCVVFQLFFYVFSK